MAQLIIDIPDALLVRVRDGASTFLGAPADATNAQKTALIKQSLANILKGWVSQAEAAQAQQLASQKAQDEVNIT